MMHSTQLVNTTYSLPLWGFFACSLSLSLLRNNGNVCIYACNFCSLVLRNNDSLDYRRVEEIFQKYELHVPVYLW